MDRDLVSLAAKPAIAGHRGAFRPAAETGESAFAARLGADSPAQSGAVPGPVQLPREVEAAQAPVQAGLVNAPESVPDSESAADTVADESDGAVLAEAWADAPDQGMLRPAYTEVEEYPDVPSATVQKEIVFASDGVTDGEHVAAGIQPANADGDNTAGAVATAAGSARDPAVGSAFEQGGTERSSHSAGGSALGDQIKMGDDRGTGLLSSGLSTLPDAGGLIRATLSAGSAHTGAVMQAAAEPAILADSRPVEHRAVLAEALRGQRDVLPWREVGASATDMRAPAAGNHPLPTGPLTFDNALMPRPTMPAVSAGILLPPEAGLMGDAEGDPSSLPSVTLSSGPAVAFSATAGSAAAVSAAGASRQVAEAVLHLYGDRTEIALSPEELGSVRLVVSRGENGPSLTVWVERPEVLEMLRRNSDALLADLQDGGLDGAALDFRDSGEWQDQGGGGSADDAAQTLAIGLTGRGDAVPDNEADHRAKSGGHDVGRLDIRV